MSDVEITKKIRLIVIIRNRMERVLRNLLLGF
jgi:hypothetical protein